MPSRFVIVTDSISFNSIFDFFSLFYTALVLFPFDRLILYGMLLILFLKLSGSTCPDRFLGKDVLKRCSKFTVEHPCHSPISIRNFIEISLRHGCSLVNLIHIFRIPFLENTSGWLLLTFE